MSDHCIMCGADIPEGRHVCPTCERWETQLSAGVSLRPANTELSFGAEVGPNFLISYRRDKPLNKFQIWMFKVCFGITAKNLRKD